MKKTLLLTLCLVIGLAFIGCGKTDAPQNTAQLANPWQSFDSLDEAEAAAGFALGMPEVIADTYKATAFRVMQGEKPLLEVTYQDEGFEVNVRKAQGEGQDISGVYGFDLADTLDSNGVKVNYYRPTEKSETPNAVVTEFNFGGYSWSFFAPNGYWGDSCEDFLNTVLPISAVDSEGGESAETEYPALIMVDGALYYHSAQLSTIEARCGMLDGTIDSMCDGKIPAENNQSNFGTGHGYQIGAGRVEVLIDGDWYVFLPFDETGEEWKFLSSDVYSEDSHPDSAVYQSFLGLHTSGYDGSTILIEEVSGGDLHIEICLFRLCDLENLSGHFESDLIHFKGVDPAGNEIKGVLYHNTENSLCMEIQDSTWEYLPVGTVFTGFDE